MKRVTIMRGLPGSGKSTEAQKIDASMICSADDYFMVNGVYAYDPAKIGEAHTACMRNFLIGLEEGWDVVVDNTNMHLFELSPYRLVALAKGYAVDVVRTVCMNSTCAKRNSHGVPSATIWRMSAAYEPLPPYMGHERIIDTNGDV